MGAGESKEEQLVQGERSDDVTVASAASASLLERVGGVRVRAVDGHGALGEVRSVQDVLVGRGTVLHIMRRFGCALCRHGCRQLSLLAPTLYRHNVALVGVGLEQRGLEPFMKGTHTRTHTHTLE